MKSEERERESFNLSIKKNDEEEEEKIKWDDHVKLTMDADCDEDKKMYWKLVRKRGSLEEDLYHSLSFSLSLVMDEKMNIFWIDESLFI